MSTTHLITQGEHLVTGEADVRISTLLGSCVACCLWDPVARVGGMNHILLAVRSDTADMAPNLTAVNAMELLINDLLKLGALRHRLLAKAFGGASMINGLSRIGTENGRFLLKYLERENIECVSHSLGGDKARHIVFIPCTGRVRMKMVARIPPAIMGRPPEQSGNGLEVF